MVASIFSFRTMGQWGHRDYYTASTFCINYNIVERAPCVNTLSSASDWIVGPAERCSHIIAKPPSESAVKAWFYNLTNSLQQTTNNEGVFPAFFPCMILTLVSKCRNLRSASPSFSKDSCVYTMKSVLRLAKRTSNVTDMKSDVAMVEIVLIMDFIFMFLCLDLVLYIEGYFTFYISHYSG